MVTRVQAQAEISNHDTPHYQMASDKLSKTAEEALMK
jgi:hypothetical protein